VPSSVSKAAIHTAVVADQLSRSHAPGSEWLFVKLYCPRYLDDEVISEAILSFAENVVASGLASSWFFVRYSDPEAHLRLRFRGSPDRLIAHLFPHICEWAGRLMSSGRCLKFVFDTYEQEVERFGGHLGMAAAEAIFFADSSSAAALVHCTKRKLWPHDQTTLLVLSIDDLLSSLGFDQSERLRWYETQTKSTKTDISAEYRQRKTVLRSTHWLPYSVAQGYAGIAIFWGYMDACFPDEKWDVTGREALELAARDAEGRLSVTIGSFSGLSGLGLAAWNLSRGGVRYRRLLTTVDDVIVPQALQLAADVRANRDGVNVGDFDAISGLSGIRSYLLLRRNEANVATALAAVIDALVELVSARDVLPRWHTPARLLWDEDLVQTYPNGNLNCGLAHGLPGVLAFLSAALAADSEAPELKAAVAHAAGWLGTHRCDDQWGVNWPTAVSIIEVDSPSGSSLQAGSGSEAPEEPSRSAWCYGSPGIARSLWLAGEALNDDHFRELAMDAMEAVFRRPAASRRIDSPTFCHGKAGLLQIALRFANDTGREKFVTESQNLVREILLAYQPGSLLGFRNIETTDREIDQPGLLDGAPGVALVLLAAISSVAPDWDRLFLLS
jgi:thiopeptide-type bacteriocin biosynthesis protein